MKFLLIFFISSFIFAGISFGQEVVDVNNLLSKQYLEIDSVILKNKIKQKTVFEVNNNKSNRLIDKTEYDSNGRILFWSNVDFRNKKIEYDKIVWFGKDSFLISNYEYPNKINLTQTFIKAIQNRNIFDTLHLLYTSSYKKIKEGYYRSYSVKGDKVILRDSIVVKFSEYPIPYDDSFRLVKSWSKNNDTILVFKKTIDTGNYTIKTVSKKKGYYHEQYEIYRNSKKEEQNFIEKKFDHLNRIVFYGEYLGSVNKYTKQINYKYFLNGDVMESEDRLDFDGKPDEITIYDKQKRVKVSTTIVYYNGTRKFDMVYKYRKNGLLDEIRYIQNEELRFIHKNVYSQ